MMQKYVLKLSYLEYNKKCLLFIILYRENGKTRKRKE